MGRNYNVKGNQYPSVTTVIEATKPPADRVRLQQYIDNLDEQGKIELEQKKRDGAKRGTAVHACMEDWLSSILGLPRDEWLDSLSKLKENPWTSQYITWIKKHANKFLATEQMVWSEKRGYAGTMDCLVEELDGSIRVWDWKTANKRKKKEWVLGYRLQTAAYGQALMEIYERKVNGSRILIAVKDGTRASNFDDEGMIYNENITLFNERLAQYIREQNHVFF